MGALIQLAGGVLRALTGAGARRAILPAAAGAIGGIAGTEIGGAGPFPGFFGLGGAGAGDGAPRRRRRRKALTNTDMQTALTIASAISKKAAENFILVRARGS